jgi:hypothetical protein
MTTPLADAAGRLATLERLIRALARHLRRLAVASAVAVIPIALLFTRDGYDLGEAVVTVLLLVPAAVVLFFAKGLVELVSLPDRLRRIPGEGQERFAEVARLGGEMRGARLRRAPMVLWRLRGAIGSLRDVAGIALPLRVLTPAFLGAAAFAAAICAILLPVGLIALVVLAAG